MADSEIGDCNILEPKAELKEIKLGNCNLVGAEVKINRNQFGDNNRIFYPGKIKVVDVFDQESHKEMIRGMYMALAER